MFHTPSLLATGVAICKQNIGTKHLYYFAGVQTYPQAMLTDKQKTIVDCDATALVVLIQKGVYTSTEILTAFITVEICTNEVTSYPTEAYLKDAFERAAKLDLHYKRTGETVGPLHGIPVAIEDHSRTNGLDMLTAWLDDDTLVEILRKSGAIVYAKTQTAQSLLPSKTTNIAVGRCVSPYNRKLMGRKNNDVRGLGSCDGTDAIIRRVGLLGRTARDLELFRRVILGTKLPPHGSLLFEIAARKGDNFCSTSDGCSASQFYFSPDAQSSPMNNVVHSHPYYFSGGSSNLTHAPATAIQFASTTQTLPTPTLPLQGITPRLPTDVIPSHCNLENHPVAHSSLPFYWTASHPYRLPPRTCEWIKDDGASCGEQIRREDVPGHLRAAHGIKYLARSDLIPCRWSGCRPRGSTGRMNRESIVRHVREVHLRCRRGSREE